jgi:hypothetical protein
MHFQVDGTSSHADVVRSALEARGVTAAPPGFLPAADARSCTWVLLDPSEEGVERAADAVRAGWNAVLRWPPRAPASLAERLVGFGEEAGAQVGLLRPLRRLSEIRPLFRGDRPAILTIAVDLPGSESARVLEVTGDLADLASALLGEAGLQRTEIESTPAGGDAFSAVAATVRYRNGSLAQLFVSFGEGAARFHLVAAGGGTVRRAVSLSPGPLPPGGGALARDVVDFVEAVGRGSQAPVPLADTIEALRVAERIGATLR